MCSILFCSFCPLPQKRCLYFSPIPLIFGFTDDNKSIWSDFSVGPLSPLQSAIDRKYECLSSLCAESHGLSLSNKSNPTAQCVKCNAIQWIVNWSSHQSKYWSFKWYILTKKTKCKVKPSLFSQSEFKSVSHLKLLWLRVGWMKVILVYVSE